MKPQNLKTKILLDSGDPAETREILSTLGFLDGQTTNPSLIAKSPQAQGKKFTQVEIYNFYQKVVKEVSSLIPEASISVEVYADNNTKAKEMLRQGRQFYKWISNAHVKYPTNIEGLKAAEMSVKEGMRVNMTLVFSQAQAAAVYAATKGAKRGDVFVSPFVGRLDDLGENGMSLIKNILTMHKTSDGHTELLTASVRNLEHFFKALAIGSDIITAPAKILKEWKLAGMNIPDAQYQYSRPELKDIPYENIDLTKNWQAFDIRHELTDKGIDQFAKDWNALIFN